MANAQELTGTVGTLSERVNLHITAGKWAVCILGSWLVAISGYLFHINGTISDLARLQADSTSKVVGELLAHPSSTSRTDVAGELNAASVILSKAKTGKQKPDQSVVQNVARRLLGDQEEFADMPEVWKTTGDFINYKFAAYLSASFKPDLGKALSFDCESINPRGALGTVFEGCNLDLEGIAAPSAIFSKCVIRYHGGPIKIREMRFLNCVFGVRISTVPSTQGVVFMKQLARASDTSSVEAST